MAAFRIILQDPALRLVTVTLILFGSYACAIAPYLSLLAVQVFGLGDRGYAAVLVAGSVVSVLAAISAGILADQRTNRRGIAIAGAALNAAGTGAVFLLPHPAVFVLAHALILPAAGALFGQLFALARLASGRHPPATRDGIMAAVRAAFALPFIAVLPLLSLAVRHGMAITHVYPLTFALSLALLAVILRAWPRDGETEWRDSPSGLPFRAALAEIARPAVAGRVGLIGAISAASTLYMAVTGLVFAGAGRGAGDVALFVGLVAGLEVPFMLAMPALLGVLDKTRLIALGAVIYALHLSLIAPLAAGPAVWLLVVPAAAGGAAFLSLPIAYLQDLMADRPGTGSSLLAVQKIAGDAVAAAAFVAGTAISGYGLAALIGAAASLTAAAALVWLDAGPRPRVTRRTP